MQLERMNWRPLLFALAMLSLLGCGESSDSQTKTDVDAGAEPECLSFDNTFDAIQSRVFDDAGCSNDACHGESTKGDLDLRSGASFASLVGADSSGSDLKRVEAGSATGSYLFQKLAAATTPDEASPINGAPMPFGADPISEELLEALRLWIVAGAPESGSVGDTSNQSSETLSNLLEACLPDAEPIAVDPLPPPAAEKGIQFAMPNFTVERESEVELCFATYYDVSERVPAEFHDGESFWYNGAQMRMDSQSHHLLITHSGLGPEFAEHEAFGGWTCRGGAQEGGDCDPLVLDGCGDGVCTSEIRPSIACTGYGPPEGGMAFASGNPSLGGIGSTQDVIPPSDGAFISFPLRGILYWNSHAFNLTKKDHLMHAWANLSYTDDRRFERVTSTDVESLYYATGIPPFTEGERCAEQVAPLGSSLVSMGSHTHKRGSNFRAWMPDDEMVYQSFHYADPLRLTFDPPILMDDPDEDGRSMRYCAIFNNGLNPDGSPNPEKVTRRSRMPAPWGCVPTACAEGDVGAPCEGKDDHASCDSEPGAGDGLCDACPIGAGVTTEHEMFVFTPEYLIPFED